MLAQPERGRFALQQQRQPGLQAVSQPNGGGSEQGTGAAGVRVVIENPGALRPNYRDSDDYRQVCRELRARLGEA